MPAHFRDTTLADVRPYSSLDGENRRARGGQRTSNRPSKHCTGSPGCGVQVPSPRTALPASMTPSFDVTDGAVRRCTSAFACGKPGTTDAMTECAISLLMSTTAQFAVVAKHRVGGDVDRCLALHRHNAATGHLVKQQHAVVKRMHVIVVVAEAKRRVAEVVAAVIEPAVEVIRRYKARWCAGRASWYLRGGVAGREAHRPGKSRSNHAWPFDSDHTVVDQA